MHDPRPIIGITFSDRIHREEKARHLAQAYLRAVEAAGGEARPLTPSEPPAAPADLHGLLLAGGVDVDPREYGEARHPKLGEVEADRDRMELELARGAAAAGVPIFGICRGIQVIGVAFGGKLHQDLPSVVPEAGQHQEPEGKRLRHRVRAAAGSRLREILGEEEVEVNTYHHQAISVPGDGLRVVAVAEDGVIEAVEGTGSGFLLGVQWHPERMRSDPRRERLFAAFVAAAAEYAAKR